MPRGARRKGESGIYHVMLRGINKQIILEDDEDHEKFKQVLKDCKVISGYKMLAYCLMGNHVHLLVKEEKEGLEQIFKRIGSRYVYWYNNKYQRTGHLFQDRFKSEPVDGDAYFLTVLRYIHQNPVKAGFCRDISEYSWSSYNDYLRNSGLTDIEFGLSLFGENKKEAVKLFETYMKKDDNIDCLDMQKSGRITDREALVIINNQCGTENAADLQKMNQEKRHACLTLLKENGLSIRQIARLTGISFGIVRRE
jgi:putative transposase